MKCESCGKPCEQRYEVPSGVDTFRRPENAYVCKECFQNQCNHHWETKDKERPRFYICKHCGKEFQEKKP